MRWSFGVALGLAAAFLAAFAAGDAFLHVDGIQGESTDSSHPGDIEIISWSYPGEAAALEGAASGHASSSGGAIRITKRVDNTSPAIMQAVTTGRRFAKATLFVPKAGGDPTEYLQYDMEGVVFSEHSKSSGGTSKGGGTAPVETVSLNFTSLAAAYTAKPQQPTVPRGLAPNNTHLPPPGNAN